jgi:hypothetical protein
MRSTLLFALSVLVMVHSGISQAVAPPTVTVSVHAPEQKGSPLRVLAFHYAPGGIGVTLRNNSDKTIVSFTSGALVNIPNGCSQSASAADTRPEWGIGSGEVDLQIQPHTTASTPQLAAPLAPARLVTLARDARSAYLHVQFGIGSVRFADGTTWEHDKPAAEKRQLLNPGLPKVDDGVCSSNDLSAVLEALSKVTRVRFAGSFSATRHTLRELDATVIPHVVFSCSLADDLATCPADDSLVDDSEVKRNVR